jgi:hypothetical protein
MENVSSSYRFAAQNLMVSDLHTTSGVWEEHPLVSYFPTIVVRRLALIIAKAPPS